MPIRAGDAKLDATGTYRYTLIRHMTGDGPPLLFVMLNPSTADARLNDRTIMRCAGFADRENAASFTVVNLFALRATDPRELRTHPSPIGPDNDLWITTAAVVCTNARGKIVVAWGEQSFARQRITHVRGMLGAFKLWSLDQTKKGDPRHPLYLRGDTPLTRWPAA